MEKHTHSPAATNDRGSVCAHALDEAIVRTLTYGDLFQFPFTLPELHRYLEATAVSPTQLAAAVEHNGRIQQQDGYIMLNGRVHLVAVRRQREAIAQTLWPLARKYGRLLAHLPFVRMVAVTGSLAVNNTASDSDIDYLVVTANGRLWLSRAFMVALVRLAQRQDVRLCPNYILAESVLRFDTQNLYTAHELTQMVPLSGHPIYHRMRRLNQWTSHFLPNAAGPPPPTSAAAAHWRKTQQLAELPFKTAVGTWLSTWEMQRKIRKLTAVHPATAEAAFSPDWCKGHFDNHQQQTLTAYQQQIEG